MKKTRLSSMTFHVWIFWAMVLCVILFGIILGFKSNSLSQFNGTLSYRENSWFFGEEGQQPEATRLSDRHFFEPGKTYELSTVLSYDGAGDQYPSAFIAAGNFEIEAFLDGKKVFSFTQKDKVIPRVQSVGAATFTISLGDDCQGKILSFKLKTPMDYASERRMPNIFFGDHSSQIRHLFLSNLPEIVMIIAILVAVVILVLLGNTSGGTQWTYVYFSLFAVLIVQYLATQNLFLVYAWANPFMALICEFFSMAACPIPLLMSYKSRMNSYYKWYFDGLIGASMANVVIQGILHFSGIVDVISMLEVTHVWLFISAVSLVLISMDNRRRFGVTHVLRKLLPIVLGSILEIFSFYTYRSVRGGGGFYPVGQFIGFGLLVSLALLIWEARQARLKAYRERERNQVLEKVAYEDALTGINNRAAFTKEISKIQSGGYPDSILVVSADLNGLKQTNDTLGHAAGDRLIQRAASLLEECLSDYGSIYRTGGDEFYALLHNVTQAQWNMILTEMMKKLHQHNTSEEIPLSIAVGCAFTQEKDINYYLQLADRNMYEDKRKCHENITA